MPNSPSLDGQITNASVASSLPAGYVDVMASCDLVITKPGYGMFVEAAAAGVPVLYMRRDGWPDVRYKVYMYHLTLRL